MAIKGNKRIKKNTENLQPQASTSEIIHQQTHNITSNQEQELNEEFQGLSTSTPQQEVFINQQENRISLQRRRDQQNQGLPRLFLNVPNYTQHFSVGGGPSGYMMAFMQQAHGNILPHPIQPANIQVEPVGRGMEPVDTRVEPEAATTPVCRESRRSSMPDIRNLHLDELEDTEDLHIDEPENLGNRRAPSTNLQQANQSIPNVHQIDPDEWLEFQSYRQLMRESQHNQAKQVNRPPNLTTVQQRMRDMAHGEQNHLNSPNNSRHPNDSLSSDERGSTRALDFRSENRNSRNSYHDREVHYPTPDDRHYHSSPREQDFRRGRNDTSRRENNDRYHFAETQNQGRPRNERYRNWDDRRYHTGVREGEDLARREKNAFEAFKRWRLQFTHKTDAAVFLSRLDQCVQNSGLREREIMNQLPTLFEGDSCIGIGAMPIQTNSGLMTRLGEFSKENSWQLAKTT